MVAATGKLTATVPVECVIALGFITITVAACFLYSSPFVIFKELTVKFPLPVALVNVKLVANKFVLVAFVELKFVENRLVPVALVKLKFVAVALVNIPFVENRLVPVAFVKLRFVVVA